jgi:dienelactone hydrolase
VHALALALVFALALALAAVALAPLRVGVRVLLLLLQEFPLLPIKPLSLLTPAPTRRQVTLDASHGPVVADLFVPRRWLPFRPSQAGPAIICAMGVRTQEKDKPIIRHVGDTLARLGYTVIWPRSASLERGVPSFEQPETFVQAFAYLADLEGVDAARISFVGFSVGSSIAMVAAEDPRIASRVHGFLFFGGYYEAAEYIASLATRTATVDGRVVPWQPHEGATGHIREIFVEAQAPDLLRVLDAKSREEARALLAAAPAAQRAVIAKLDPSAGIDRLQAQVFILHDRGDPYVPYGESLKLARALARRGGARCALVDLFEHVQPRHSLSPAIITELAKLYVFLAKVLMHF